MIDDEVVFYKTTTDTKNLVKEKSQFNWFQVLLGRILSKLSKK
jgi:hypothetical protein